MNILTSIFDYFLNNYINHNNGYTFILTDICACIAIALIFNRFELKKWQFYLRLLIDISATWVILIIVGSLIEWIFESIGNVDLLIIMSFMKWLFVGLIHTAYPRNVYPNYIMRATCAFALSFIIITSVQLSGTIGGMINEGVQIYKDLTLYSFLIFIILCVCLFKLVNPFKYRYVKPLPLIMINVIYILSIIYVITVSQNFERSSIKIFALSMSLVISTLAYLIFYFSCKAYNVTIDFQIRAIKAENEKNQIEISLGQYEELHKIRHDLLNKMTVLKSLIENQKYDEANKFFADLNDNINISTSFIDTSNTLVNSILNMESTKAINSKIPIKYHVAIPSELNISPNDLTSLLTNILDNAIEAHKRENINEPINFSLIYEAPYLYIRSSNKFGEKENIKSLKSSKKDRKNHGYGTKIIDEIIKKYNGTKNIIVDDNLFIFQGMIEIKGDKNE